ncbi:rRNA maturation RNase YbeY [Aerococcus kribbianus]|uniref:Endoribonuclease YbeY n=1 Tax=Aerococcus kribbianus TaxID=2999064 RepID=A0A9X3FU52_9LACT|nr:MULTISPECIES: rRNA maturation RNase YbeY [unclassified Aerococcus]MCZ0716921.1 rRNA maturation RNase YbeY [Aerococcus sp. YH-aer221]MCZ0725209.1 rRNA maturation RNase YbeY [Aerococcus sp. YH-aer222]
MNVELNFFDESHDLSTDNQALIEKLLVFAGDYLHYDRLHTVSVTIVDDARIQAINRDYRDKDQSTDVISFAIQDQVAGELPIVGFEDMPVELGDIFISLDTAKAQAKDYGHSLQRELGFLALHGFLHLNGYDHMTPEDEHVMFSLQKEILDAYGLKRD